MAGNKLRDLRILEVQKLDSPEEMASEIPVTEKALETVVKGRREAQGIIRREDNRFLLVVGPCSIHDTQQALVYASRLAELRSKYSDKLCIFMRVYFEKPRTTVGWKGLINDPHMDGSFDVEAGLQIARKLLLELVNMGLPLATEALDPNSPQYLGDLFSWSAIGARTTESQTHREMASGLSMPVGFKNGTDGNVKIACDAIGAAEHSHSFLSVTKGGISAIVTTTGNEDCHIILRGGKTPNYDAQSVNEACEILKANGHREMVMIDASHSNSHKKFKEQITVVNDICKQVSNGDSRIIGVMIESNLVEGNQKIDLEKGLVYGQSVTDACLGWEDTAVLLNNLARAVRDRRSRNT